MREEIGLFRGESLASNQWVYGYLIALWTKEGQKQRYAIDTCCEYNHNEESLDVIEVDPETVSEYMGFKDRTNKRIYEGDRLRHHRHNVYSTMKWIKKYACFAGVEDETLYFYQEGDSKDLEIVGNVYERVW